MSDPLPGLSVPVTENETDEWYTPRRIFDAIDLEFDCDPAAVPTDRHDFVPGDPIRWRREHDGLHRPWTGRVWLNPPYSDPSPWMDKLRRHCLDGTAVTLLPASTDTMWWQNTAAAADTVLFVMGRVVFIDGENQTTDPVRRGARFPSSLMAFGDAESRALQRSGLGVWTGGLR